MPPEDTSPQPPPEAPAPLQEPSELPQTVPEPEPSPTTEPATPTDNQTAQMGRNEPLPATPVVTHPIRDLLDKARIAIQDHKRKKRDKIMAALTTKTKITNDEVEKLLHVSDATATRYLSALEKEGKIKQIGRTGKSVVYSKL